MAGLLIANGLVVDGTGGAGKLADLRIRDGLIVEVGENLAPAGEEVINAAGAVVAPGFIDSHTHFDATVYWDPLLDPMPQHGVTTVVAGNCSLGLAPMRPGDRRGHVDVFSYIEDMPADLLNAVIPWDWETYPEYVRSLGKTKLGVNLVTFVGHSQLRCHVMGEAAWERAASPDEIAAMAAELDEALAAGAAGMSFSLFDKDRSGRPVPSCLADDAEMDALCARLGAHGALLQFVVGGDEQTAGLYLERLCGFLRRHKVAGLFNAVAHDANNPDRANQTLAMFKQMQGEGIQIHGLVSPRPMIFLVGFEQSLCFIDLPAWNRLVQADREEQRRLAADPDWRAQARGDADSRFSVMFPFRQPERLTIHSVPGADQREWAGRTLADLANERGGHVSDALADWLLETDFEPKFSLPIANTDIAGVGELLANPVSCISGSDAGAHLQMFCAYGDTTLLLTRYVRDRGALSLEAAVHALTQRQAEMLGLRNRGVIAPGKAADVIVFALDELVYGEDRLVNDLPGGLPRLTRDPGGFRYTIVNGEIVQASGKATGALPARWLARAA
ncbi:MAG: amidohydrolase family protein [Novosphingobium sp.]